jgi:hypothetical protein
MNKPEENQVNNSGHSAGETLPSHQDGAKIVEGANLTDQLEKLKESAVNEGDEPASGSQTNETPGPES